MGAFPSGFTEVMRSRGKYFYAGACLANRNVGVDVSCDSFFDRPLESGVRVVVISEKVRRFVSAILDECFYFLDVFLMQLILVSKLICVYVYFLIYYIKKFH